MVLVALAHAKEFAVAHEAPEFQGGVEVDIFSKDKVVWHFRQQSVRRVVIDFIRRVGNAVVEWVVQVVGNEVAAFEEEVNVVRGAALCIVCGGHEGCVFGCAPVQFRGDLAEFFDRVLYLGMNICPFS